MADPRNPAEYHALSQGLEGATRGHTNEVSEEAIEKRRQREELVDRLRQIPLTPETVGKRTNIEETIKILERDIDDEREANGLPPLFG